MSLFHQQTAITDECVRHNCPSKDTYAGGANSLADLEQVARLGGGKIHLTIGSALDIFGGTGVKYDDCVQFNRKNK